MSQFFAHSANGNGNWHDLSTHLQTVAQMACTFAKRFNAGQLGYWAGLWHDLGKFHPDFQAYLKNPQAARGPDHSSTGMVHASKFWDGLSFLVAGHHAGLPSVTGLKTRLSEKKSTPATLVALDTAQSVLPEMMPSSPLTSLLIALDQLRGNQTRHNLELFLRMLFSALVDADFLDTEAHFRPERPAQRSEPAPLAEMLQQFEVNQGRLSGRESNPLQQARHEIYQSCVNAADMEPGLFRLTVPTGGGKTRSSMSFALRHAIKHGLERVIYAIPYTSIIEQTSEVFRGIFGDNNVLEHHSAIGANDDPQSPVTAQQQWSRLASENWDASLIVTTTVQLFESLFAHKPSKCRKLHRIAGSVIILDEVQTLPPPLLQPILDILGQLAKHYRVTVVLCTATQPALTANRYLNGLENVREIIPNPERYFQILKRVRYEIPSGTPWSWDRVALEMKAVPQCLAIVNTKKDAHLLLDALGDDSTVLHLSTQMCGIHRAETLREVKRRLYAGEPCRLASTQVIEAGVDIDFPLVLRAVGPLDRIVQAAGRCNREGKLPEGGRVVIFEPCEASSPPGSYRTGLDTASSMLKAGCDLHDPGVYERYFSLLFQSVNLDVKKIQQFRERLDYPEVASRFRLIDEDTVPVIVRPKAHESTVDALLEKLQQQQESPRWLIRKLQRFIVAVYGSKLSGYEANGLMKPVATGLWEWRGEYDPLRGLVDALNPDQLVF
jgi:CRISPR-associated endonuclease/helicase Cas3